MKKYQSILIAAVLATCVASAFAQGTVVFNNGPGLVLQLTSAADLTLKPVPQGGGQVQLFWAATGTPFTPWTPSLTPAAWYSNNPGWSLGPVTGFTLPEAGKFDGGTLTLSPLAPGGTIDYVVIGWTGTVGSFDAALASGSIVAISSRFTSATGNPTTVPPGDAVPLANSFEGLALTVPEPSSIALAGLGASALLALRRVDEIKVGASGCERPKSLRNGRT